MGNFVISEEKLPKSRWPDVVQLLQSRVRQNAAPDADFVVSRVCDRIVRIVGLAEPPVGVVEFRYQIAGLEGALLISQIGIV